MVVNNAVSSTAILNTGAPQGCVLSPVLFSLYTNDCRAITDICIIPKYADDTALVAMLLSDETSEQVYFTEVENFSTYCSENGLELNVPKTNELIIDFRRNKNEINKVIINGQEVEQVDIVKYLGTLFDNKLNFTANTDRLVSKGNQRMYLLRKLKSFNVKAEVLELVFTSMVNSVITHNSVTWFGNLNKYNIQKLDRITKQASKLVGKNLPTVEDTYNKSLIRKSSSVIKDDSHPLNEYFNKLPSGRRYRAPLARKNSYKNSFVPSAIRQLNSISD